MSAVSAMNEQLIFLLRTLIGCPTITDDIRQQARDQIVRLAPETPVLPTEQQRIEEAANFFDTLDRPVSYREVFQAGWDACLRRPRPAQETCEQPRNWAIWRCYRHERLFAAHAGCSMCATDPDPSGKPAQKAEAERTNQGDSGCIMTGDTMNGE